jgi:DNA-3-methyladenine glycosylase
MADRLQQRVQRAGKAPTAVPTAEAEPRYALRRLTRAELPSDTSELARWLIGKTLVHERGPARRRVRLSGRIVETEAYVPGDASGHAFRGETARNGSLFRELGRAYVYFVYGCWHCLNVAAEREGIGAGVLFRALEPLEGIATMTGLRGGAPLHELARGPGRLTAALGIDLRQDGLDLCTHPTLWLADAVRPPGEVATSVRIGISKEVDRPLRFYERGNRFVSGSARMRG